jgi:hypothetical protein
MRTFVISLLTIVLCSCNKTFLGSDPQNNRIAIFEEFSKKVNTTWPEFATSNVNWDSLYHSNYPLANSAKNDVELSVSLQNLINGLKDRHTSIYSKDKNKIDYFPKYPPTFYGFKWITQDYIPYYLGNNVIAYRQVRQNVGYIFIASFFSSSDKFSIIDDIISNFSTMKGIIIDVRSNSGGIDRDPGIIASRFADQTRTYGYRRYRINDQRTSMGNFIQQNISPSGTQQFKGKVAILTNRYSFSATEDFVLMMRSFPNVIQIGDNTAGGSGTDPILIELPNGWTCRMSTALLCNSNKQSIDGGIIPDFYVQTTKTDSLSGKDTIIEKAILELQK